MKRIVLAEKVDDSLNVAGSKARNDVVSILENEGFTKVVMFDKRHGLITRRLEMIPAIRRMKELAEQDNGAVFLIQYPNRPGVIRYFFNSVSKWRKKCEIKTIMVIHDVQYLRQFGTLKKDDEIALYQLADVLIVHNDIMKEQLLHDGVTRPMISLDIFDYLYGGADATISQDGKTRVVFAGNLAPEKSSFLYSCSVGDKITFSLYGPNHAQLNSNYEYRGSFHPDKLIANLYGNYGLVWDGTSAEACDGKYGSYLRYNNPHKLSLYLAAGFPLIVWSQSAAAEFVLKNGIGVTVDSLNELDRLPSPGSMEYRIMLGNVTAFKAKLRSGYFLKEAVHKALDIFSTNAMEE